VRLTRSRALALIGSAAFLTRCGSSAVRVGSKNFSENVTLAEIYAAALEEANIRVERHMIVGNTLDAIRSAEIQLYPEYLGTGLVNILQRSLPHATPDRILQTLRREYKPFGLTWLHYAKASDSQGLAVTRRVARDLNVHTLSQCASMAPRLRLVAPPEFLQRLDGLLGLRRFYNGGFRFKAIRALDIGVQYDALANREAEVALVFTSSPQIARHDLLVLEDDRHFWPPYNIAPVVRLDALRTHPRIEAVLDGVSARLAVGTLRELNAAVEVDECDPPLVARQFLSGVSTSEFNCADLHSRAGV